jgi:hypothetical protein
LPREAFVAYSVTPAAVIKPNTSSQPPRRERFAGFVSFFIGFSKAVDEV